MIVVVMGVAGSGKTTIGQMLSDQIGWEFIEGDSLHPAKNIEKMQEGRPLTETDREPWLRQIEQSIEDASSESRSLVLAASVLRKNYRDRFRAAGSDVRFVYLKGSYEQVQERLNQRADHFFEPNLLRSQFEVLEPPQSAIVADVDLEPEEIVSSIRLDLSI